MPSTCGQTTKISSQIPGIGIESLRLEILDADHQDFTAYSRGHARSLEYRIVEAIGIGGNRAFPNDLSLCSIKRMQIAGFD